MRQAVILCGGKGTRLGAGFSHLPKPLVPVDGIPLLDRILGTVAEAGVREVLLAAGHLGQLISDRYRDHNPWGLEIRTHIEAKPLGTAGCLLEVGDLLDDDFALLYGDVFLDFDLGALIRSHEEMRPEATVLVRQSDHPADSDLVEWDSQSGAVAAFLPKATRDSAGFYRNWGNAAVYCCSRRLLEVIPSDRSTDIATDAFPALLRAGGRIQARVLEDTGYVKDMGTPARLVEVERYWNRKQRARAGAEAPGRIKAVIFDRDGTLVENREPLSEVDQLVFLPEVLESLAELHRAGIACMVATNQPWIARGLLTEAAMGAVHEALKARVEAAGGKLLDIEYSPYHPETHHGEGITAMRRSSECRKPRPGMLFSLMERHGFLPGETVMTGDARADIIAGKNAGVRTVLVGGDGAGLGAGPDAAVASLSGVVRQILLWNQSVNL